MVPCVITPGTTVMPLWSAASWDSHVMVRYLIKQELFTLELPHSFPFFLPPSLLPSSFTGAIAVVSGVFSATSDHSIGDVQCIGSEGELLDCTHNTSVDPTCSDSNDASVVCQGM